MTAGRFVYFFAAFLFLPAAPSCAAAPLSLEEAIAFGVAHNKDLLRSADSLEIGVLGETEAATQFWPHVVPQVSTTLGQAAGEQTSATSIAIGVTQELESGTVMGASFGGVQNPGDPHYQRNVHLEIQQPLFRNFGRQVNREPLVLAGSEALTARRKYEMQKADLIVQIAEAYGNVVKLEQTIDSEERAVRRSESLYRVTLAKEAVGKTTRVDTLRTRLLKGEAQSRLEDTRVELTRYRQQLAYLLGLPLNEDVTVEEPAMPAVPHTSPEQALRIALGNRLDEAQSLADLSDARRAASLARRRLMPDIRVTLSYDSVSTVFTPIGLVNAGKPLWLLSVSAPTEFQPERERIAVRRAEIAEATAEEAAERERTAIEQDVSQQLNGYARAKKEVQIAKSNLELAEHRNRLAKALFGIGRVESSAVTDAELTFLQAQSQLIAAKANAMVSAFRLLRSLGILTPVPDGLRPRTAN